MKVPFDALPNARGVLAHIGNWSSRMPGRLRHKLLSFERTIGNFRQRRWL
jgi:hypothetical protein